jgi:hypothetical protein
MKTKESFSLPNYLVPRLQDILFVSVFYLILVLGTNLFRDGDPGRHITVGKYMIESGSILTSDVFSFTMQSEAITPHEWIAQLIYGAADMLMGLNGVVMVTALILSTTFILIYLELLARDIPRLLAFGLTLWAAAITMVHWLARPHLFTLLFLAIFVPRMGKLYQGRDVPLWQFGAIMLLWANTHGAFIFGFVIWGAYLVAWLIENWRNGIDFTSPILRKLLAAGGLSFLVTFINPVGWRLWETSVGYVSSRYFVDRTSEYRSIDFHSIGAWPFLGMLALLLLISLRKEKKLPLGETFLITGFAVMGIYSTRHIPPFAVVVVPLVGALFAPYFNRIPALVNINHRIETLEHNLRGIFWPIAIVAACLVMLSFGVKLDASQKGYHFNPVEFPVEAVNWIEENPMQGNMFNQFRWGGYLLYRLWPSYLVFMDGQTDFYGERLTRQHDQILEAQDGWQAVVDEYNIEWMIVSTDSRIVLQLEDSSAWNIVYRDDTATILRKQP